MSELRFGLVGCGGMGRAVASGASAIEGCRVTAVCDLLADRCEAASEQFGATITNPFTDLVARDDVDVVIVATHPSAHRMVVEAAAAAGKHIFCEKPLAASHDDALAMVEAVNKAGVTAMCGQVVRWHPTHRRLKDMVDNGPLGGVLTMYVERRQGNWEGHPSWRLSLEKSGGTLLEVNAHELDFMLWLGGPAKTVYAVGANRIERAQDYPDFAHVSITHQSGAISVLSSSNIAVLGSYDGRFDCAHGSAVVDALFGGEIRYALRNGESGTVSPEEMKVETPVTGEVRALVEAIRAGKPSPVPFEQAAHTVAVGRAAYRSIELGAPVDL